MFTVTREPLEGLGTKRVVVLPDLFVDILAPLPPWRATRSKLDSIAERGGGNLLVDRVNVKIGGNAANLALALARLGAHVDLIAETDELGWSLAQRDADEAGLGLEGVRVGPRASRTVALEFEDANVMLSDPGPLVDFGPDRLREQDWRLLEAADAVAVLNWAQNTHGTELLRALSERLDHENVFLYVDTGDPTNRAEEARELLADKTLWHGVDAWSMNENELETFSQDGREEPLAAAQSLSDALGVRVDLHTRRWAATLSKGPSVQVDADDTPARRLTGAGDAWNAGNVAAHLLGWSDVERLELAHRVATLYVTSRDGKPPTAKEVARP